MPPHHMFDLFSTETRRNPYPLYEQIRNSSPLVRIPPPFDAWAIFDYDGVKRIMSDHDTFSSRVPAPAWFLFMDPPQHTKLRGLISKAFTPALIGAMAPRVHAIASQLLDRKIADQEMDLAADFSVPLPMMVIAEIIGIPLSDWPRYTRWSESILALSHSRSGGPKADEAALSYATATAEMDAWLEATLEERRREPKEDLLTRLLAAELDGQRLNQQEILGLFQLLILGGQETTTNLINNAVLTFLEHPDQLARLNQSPQLLPSAIEEVLRFRSPFLWMMRTPRTDVQLHGHTVPAGTLILAMVASANRDPRQFDKADAFDIARDPNSHLSFGHGIHYCLGAALARMEAKIALDLLFERLGSLQLASSEPWEPREALHVQGPGSLRVRFAPNSGTR